MDNISLTDAIMYKCRKEVTLLNFKQTVCKWRGTFDEYIQHVKVNHAESYFFLQKEWEKFQWKLPFLGDQTDTGILEHQMGHFFYEIYYEEDIGKLYFSIVYLTQSASKCNPLYKLLLKNETEENTFTSKTNMEVGEISKPIYEQFNNIIINKNMLSKYTDQTRIFQWFINIIDCDTESLLNEY